MPASSDSSDDNDTLDSLSIGKSSFRVSVCLKRYFKDIRALCFLLVTRKRTVRWLERRIRKIFDLRGTFHLQTRGHLLPSSERLGLLNPDDVVEVIPLEKGSQNSLQNEKVLHNTKKYLDSRGQDIPDTGAESRVESFAECDLTTNGKANKCQEPLEIGESNLFDKSGHQDILLSNSPKKIKSDHNKLQQLKHNALAFLESKYNGVVLDETHTFQDTVIPRKRRRVRRKRQRVVSSPTQELTEESIEAAHELPNNNSTEVEPEDHHNLYDHRTDIHTSGENFLKTSTIVAHNEVACARRPRIVRSLINTL